MIDHFSDDRSDPRVFFAHLLLQFRLALTSNNHSVSEIDSISGFVTRKSVALAIYPTAASLINHSCDPNTSTVAMANAAGLQGENWDFSLC
jgi:hypothetical protein